MATLNEIVSFADELLQVDNYHDYCPNGLQIEGKSEVKKMVCGVTASQALIDSAIDHNADLIIVHHGFFWRGESLPIIGLKKNRIKALMDAEISLVAYHLPLDGHRELGNNAQIAQNLGVNTERWFGASKPEICLLGSLDTPTSSTQFAKLIAQKLTRQPLHLRKNDVKRIVKVGICTGGAQNYFELAIEQGVDAFITGEVSEQSYHLAIESGVDFYSAGHHATERFGVQALAKVISEKFNLEYEYIEIENPV